MRRNASVTYLGQLYSGLPLDGHQLVHAAQRRLRLARDQIGPDSEGVDGVSLRSTEHTTPSRIGAAPPWPTVCTTGAGAMMMTHSAMVVAHPIIMSMLRRFKVLAQKQKVCTAVCRMYKKQPPPRGSR